MKLFFQKTGLFLLMISMLLILFTFLNHTFYEKEAERQDAYFTDSVTVLLIGDSHAECGVDPARFPEMINRASSAECLYYNRIKNRYYARKGKIRTCILSFHYFSLSKHWEEGVTGMLREEQMQKYAHFYFRDPAKADWQTCFHSPYEYGKYTLLSRFHLPTKQSLNQGVMAMMGTPSDIASFGAYTPSHVSNIGNPDLCQSKLDETIFRGQTNPDHYHLDAHLSQLMHTCLTEIIQDNQKNGIETILLNLPCHPDFNSRIPDVLKHHIDSIALSFEPDHCRYLNLYDYPLPDSCFRDYDHLNARGAEIITPIIRNFVLRK